jgi:phosphoesterase RecJ-like protein
MTRRGTSTNAKRLSGRDARQAASLFQDHTVPSEADYAEAIAELKRARRIAMTCHVKPDGDALGCIAALRHWLLAEGKTVEVIVPTPPPPKYDFIDPDRSVKVAGRDVDLRRLAPPDLVCVVDTCTWLQLAGMEPLVRDSSASVLAIDHHRTRDALADFQLVDPGAAATAVLVYHLLRQAGAPIDAETAAALFVGLALDTDWFRLPNVEPETFTLAAALVEAGANPSEIHDLLYQNDDLARVQLRGRAIESLRTALDGRAAVMRLTQALFRECGADVGDTENLINEGLRIRGTQVAVMLVEADGDEVRVSLRARPPVNVLQVAEQFGGGGHHRAAGARLTGSLDEVEARVLEAVRRVLDAAGPPPSGGPRSGAQEGRKGLDKRPGET